jgi:type IV pilus assembly protein PilM
MNIGNKISDFFLDIFNFLRGRTVLGVDIGTSSIKIAELKEVKGKITLSNYGILETKAYLNHPNRAFQTSSLPLDEKVVAHYLKVLLKEMKTKSRIALSSIPSFTSFSTVIDMPLMSDKETEKAVMFQAPQYLPFAKGEALIDWIKTKEFETKEGKKYQSIFVIGISQKVIESYKKVFKEAGLKLVALEFDGLAFLRALIDAGDKDTVIVDIGGEETEIFISSSGSLMYAGGTSYSGIHLTQAIARSLDITPLRAESLKRSSASLIEENGKSFSEFSFLLTPFLDVILQEVNHIIDVYKRKYGKMIERVMVVGGGANLNGIGKYFASQLGLLEAKPNIFRKVDYNIKLEPISRNLNNELALAIGLAQKYFKW